MNMIKKLYLNNYKSFKDINISFLTPSKEISNIHLIYGENGSGKSNIISVFSLLDSLRKTLTHNERFSKFLNKFKEDKDMTEFFKQSHLTNLLNIPKIIDAENLQYKGSDDPIELSITILIDDVEAEYYLKLKEDIGVIEEKLVYTVVKNRGVLFHIKRDIGDFNLETRVQFSPNLFGTNKLKDTFKNNIDTYWGNHSFISIIDYELSRGNMNENYLYNHINENYLKFSHILETMSVDHKGAEVRTVIGSNLNEVMSIAKEGGKLPKNKNSDRLLNQSEQIVSYLFSSLYTDIESAYYEIKDKDDFYEYKLYFKKNIENQLVDIPISIESSGTKQILRLVPMIVSLLDGNIVIIDEIDAEVHDLLMKVLIEGLMDVEIGQLIATTHNTLLLQSIHKNNAYIIEVDSQSNKQLINLGKHSNKIQASNSLYNQYLNGNFGGIPYIDYFDYEIIKDIFGESYEQS